MQPETASDLISLSYFQYFHIYILSLRYCKWYINTGSAELQKFQRYETYLESYAYSQDNIF